MKFILIGLALGILGFAISKSWMIIPTWGVLAVFVLLLIVMVKWFKSPD